VRNASQGDFLPPFSIATALMMLESESSLFLVKKSFFDLRNLPVGVILLVTAVRTHNL
jgi:hypothetical protein